jgi:alpha-glucoside transport system substrate-binding protein
MKKTFMMGVAALALFAGAAHAADLVFKPGEDTRFSWASYDEFKKAHGDL